MLAHRLDQVLLLDVRVVLGRQHHGVQAFDLVRVFGVAQGDLRFCIRAQPLQLAGFFAFFLVPSTPAAMSGDCLPSMLMIAQVWPSKPTRELS